MGEVVLTLTVLVPLLAMWAAYITCAISAETDIRDDYGPGQLTWVWLHVTAPLKDRIPLCPPMHSHVVHAEAYVEPSPLLYGRPPVHVTGQVMSHG